MITHRMARKMMLCCGNHFKEGDFPLCDEFNWRDGTYRMVNADNEVTCKHCLCEMQKKAELEKAYFKETEGERWQKKAKS